MQVFEWTDHRADDLHVISVCRLTLILFLSSWASETLIFAPSGRLSGSLPGAGSGSGYIWAEHERGGRYRQLSQTSEGGPVRIQEAVRGDSLWLVYF